MKFTFKKGDKKHYSFIVNENDSAHFEQQAVHNVCATFTLAREIEWSTRLFVLEMLEEGEEGIGTHLNIKHSAPAFIGEKVDIISEFSTIEKGEIICLYQAKVRDRLVATGTTGQKILPKDKIASIFERLAN